ncbi:MAG: hypothetical protein ABI616_10685 [Pseudomonadota bacterium]
MNNRGPLEVDYCTLDDLAVCRAQGWMDILGLTIFSIDDVRVDTGNLPVAHVKMAPLGNTGALCEVWRAQGPFRTGQMGHVQYRASDNFVFGCIDLTEPSTAGGRHPDPTLSMITEQAYTELFRCIEFLGFPHLVRIWNHLPEINCEADGLERYRQFNEARQRSFLAFRAGVAGNVPAACALGSPQETSLVVYFLAGKETGTAIENPRQISSWDYPAEYGAFSPMFSRAILAKSSNEAVLLVSGTASIVGHQTVHANRVLDQARETASNLCALVAEVNRKSGQKVFSTQQLQYKVYVRHREDYEVVAQELQRTLRPSVSPVFLQADICRSDLLVEVEAVGLPC